MRITKKDFRRNYKIEFDTFNNLYNAIYSAIYETEETVGVVYDRYVDDGDRMLKNSNNMMIDFAMLRHDPLTSDREIASFAIAYRMLEKVRVIA